MKSLFASLAVMLLILGCSREPATPSNAPSTNAAAADGSVVTAPVDYLKAVGKGQQSAVKTVDTTSLNKAIQLFNIDQGRNPKDLNELVEHKYIPQVPAAPYGMKLTYDSTAGTVKVTNQ
ncbi:MAG TPA: hypothetical protein VN673_07020 [Clostridia bacterium]|nr:hypothetical protein [Clostridia bacterium]